jgi:hypothetical protein
MAVVGVGVSAAGAAVAILWAVAAARHGERAAERVVTFTAEGVAWSAGIMIAFGAALRAFHRDREQGVLSLARVRGASVAQYARGRVGGLVLVLAATVGGPTLLATLAATAAGGGWSSVRGGLAGLAYALAFAASVGPVALAALGAKTRTGGYFTLLAVLVLPEVVSPWTSGLLPHGWWELTSIPAALKAVRLGVAQPIEAGASAARAVAALAAVVAVAVLVVGVRARRAETEPPS